MLRGLDISNMQGPPTIYTEQEWYRAAEFVIVQSLRPPYPYPGWEVAGYTGAQIRQAHADGKYVGAYVWLWNNGDLDADIRSKLALIPGDVPLNMRLWLDVEDTEPTFKRDRVLRALELCDAWATAKGLPPTGVYTGDWFINGHMGGWFPPGRVYWQADYSQAPIELSPMRPIRQYTSSPVDLNVMLESEIVGHVAEPEEPTAADFRQALAYLSHDVVGPLGTYKYPRIKAAVAEVERVAAQYGAA